MGIVKLPDFDSTEPHIPNFPVNYALLNKCYLIMHDPNDLKNTPMSVLIDIDGNSTDTNIKGYLTHDVIATMDDRNVPHTTQLRNDHGKVTETKFCQIENI